MTSGEWVAFTGCVEAFQSSTGLWRVVYSDGDREYLSWGELAPILNRADVGLVDAAKVGSDVTMAQKSLHVIREITDSRKRKGLTEYRVSWEGYVCFVFRFRICCMERSMWRARKKIPAFLVLKLVLMLDRTSFFSRVFTVFSIIAYPHIYWFSFWFKYRAHH